MLIFTGFQILLIVSLLLIKFTGGFIELYIPFFIAALICTAILFYLGLPIIKTLLSTIKKQNKFTGLVVQGQFLLHIPILIVIVLDQFYSLDYNSMLGVSPLLVAFFATAVITWRACFSIFKSKIYKIFSRGSTVFFAWSVALTLLGLFYQPHFLTENLHSLMLVYFAVHFAELGFVLLKISKDLHSL